MCDFEWLCPLRRFHRYTRTHTHSGWQVPLNCSVNRYAMLIQCSLLFKHTVRILLNAPIWLWRPEWATNSQGHRTGVTIITTHTHLDTTFWWIECHRVFFFGSRTELSSWSERVLMFSGHSSFSTVNTKLLSIDQRFYSIRVCLVWNYRKMNFRRFLPNSSKSNSISVESITLGKQRRC